MPFDFDNIAHTHDPHFDPTKFPNASFIVDTIQKYPREFIIERLQSAENYTKTLSFMKTLTDEISRPTPRLIPYGRKKGSKGKNKKNIDNSGCSEKNKTPDDDDDDNDNDDDNSSVGCLSDRMSTTLVIRN